MATQEDTPGITIDTLGEHLAQMGVVRMPELDKSMFHASDALMMAFDRRDPNYGKMIRDEPGRILLAQRHIMNGREVADIKDDKTDPVDRRPRLAMMWQLQSPRDDKFAVMFAHAMYLWPLVQPCFLRMYLRGPDLAFEWTWPGVELARTGAFRTSTLVNGSEIADAADVSVLAEGFATGTMNQMMEDLMHNRGMIPGAGGDA